MQLFYASLSVLVFLCEIALTFKTGCHGGYCFTISESNNGEVDTQQGAIQQCSSDQSQLVEIISIDIQNSLTNVTQSKELTGSDFIITNGRRGGSPTNWKRLSGVEIGDSLNSILDQPNASYAYGYLNSTTFGFVINATTPTDNKEGYICSNVSDCANGATINGTCYKAYIESLSWYGARNRCLDAGGDLASFDYITTNDGFNALDVSLLSTSYRYWIGFRREWWTWQSSSEDVSYSFWSNGSPTDQQDCLCLMGWWLQWTECNCTERYRFVCIFSRPNQSSTTVTSTTSVPSTAKTAVSSSSSSVSEVGLHSWSTSLSSISGSNQTSTFAVSSTNNPGLSYEAKLGIGIGVGVGCFLIIAVVVVIVVIVIVIRKRDTTKGDERNIQAPGLIANQGNGISRAEKVTTIYATVLKSPEPNDNTTEGFRTTDQSRVVYADLQINSSNSSSTDSSSPT